MKIALVGYGKMGKAIEQIARERGHEIVSIIDINKLPVNHKPQVEFGVLEYECSDILKNFFKDLRLKKRN